MSDCEGNDLTIEHVEELNAILQGISFNDTSFKVGDREFPACLEILSVESEVLARMFEPEFLKKHKKNQVKILDVNAEVFGEMLRFIYTKKLFRLEEMAEELLAVSNKYQVYKLKILCEETLMRRLSHENCLDMFLLGDLHQADNLKIQAFEVFAENPDAEKLKTFIENYNVPGMKLIEMVILCSRGTMP